MTILECSCGLYLHLLAATVPLQHRILPKEGCDAASYLVRYGDSGHTYALYLHPLRFICIEVLCWYEVDTLSIVFILHYVRKSLSVISRLVTQKRNASLITILVTRVNQTRH
jgi:hypothetical protein